MIQSDCGIIRQSSPIENPNRINSARRKIIKSDNVDMAPLISVEGPKRRPCRLHPRRAAANHNHRPSAASPPFPLVAGGHSLAHKNGRYYQRDAQCYPVSGRIRTVSLLLSFAYKLTHTHTLSFIYIYIYINIYLIIYIYI